MFSQELTQFGLNPRNELIPLFIGKRRNPQFSSRSGPESALTRVCGRLTCRPNKLQDLLEISVDRPQLDFSSLSISVDPILWVSTLCACRSTKIRTQSLKILFSLFLILSLSTLITVDLLFSLLLCVYNRSYVHIFLKWLKFWDIAET